MWRALGLELEPDDEFRYMEIVRGVFPRSQPCDIVLSKWQQRIRKSVYTFDGGITRFGVEVEEDINSYGFCGLCCLRPEGAGI